HELTIGDEITSSENKVGTVINSVNHSNGNYALAVLELNKIEQALLVNNINVEIIKLPYDIAL
ncbi:MAG: hypothetical protein ACPHLK_06655, partial [Gammaproteobacteria bacterium]